MVVRLRSTPYFQSGCMARALLIFVPLRHPPQTARFLYLCPRLHRLLSVEGSPVRPRSEGGLCWAWGSGEFCCSSSHIRHGSSYEPAARRQREERIQQPVDMALEAGRPARRGESHHGRRLPPLLVLQLYPSPVSPQTQCHPRNVDVRDSIADPWVCSMLYAFHLMACDEYYDHHAPFEGPEDRKCSIDAIAAETAKQFTITGMSTTFCGMKTPHFSRRLPATMPIDHDH